MNWKPVVCPKRYQDVKTTLVWYTCTVVFTITFIICLFLFEEKFTAWCKQIKEIESLLKLGGFGVGELLFSGFFGYVLIFLFEIHDKIYDRYIVRWRYFYDIDFILPRLTRPFAQKLSRSFYYKAEQDKTTFMQPYYVFVGDGDHEFKIKDNLILRFYEKILKYWMTQINELILFFVFVSVVVLKFWSSITTDKLFVILIVCVVLFLLNRFFVSITRSSVRYATVEEIEAIHSSFSNQLDKELKDLHEKIGLEYG